MSLKPVNIMSAIIKLGKDRHKGNGKKETFTTGTGRLCAGFFVCTATYDPKFRGMFDES